MIKTQLVNKIFFGSFHVAHRIGNLRLQILEALHIKAKKKKKKKK